MTTGPQASARRLFFALWPEPQPLLVLSDCLRRLVPAGTGRPQRPDQLHLTLEFLGNVAESRLSDVLEAGAAVAGTTASCSLVLDQVEHWKRPQVLCLTAQRVPEPLNALVGSLRSQLLARGFVPEKRPFRAHLTLARKVRRAPPAATVDPINWPAREFSLVESVTAPSGSRYARLATWPLGA